MKKKYCAPVIKAVLFKAEEAVSACIFNPYTGESIQNVTPEDDYWLPWGDNWAYGSNVRGGNPDYWYTRRLFDGYWGYHNSGLLISNRPNASG